MSCNESSESVIGLAKRRNGEVNGNEDRNMRENMSQNYIPCAQVEEEEGKERVCRDEVWRHAVSYAMRSVRIATRRLLEVRKKERQERVAETCLSEALLRTVEATYASWAFRSVVRIGPEASKPPGRGPYKKRECALTGEGLLRLAERLENEAVSRGKLEETVIGYEEDGDLSVMPVLEMELRVEEDCIVGPTHVRRRVVNVREMGEIDGIYVGAVTSIKELSNDEPPGRGNEEIEIMDLDALVRHTLEGL
jgi:hypothetical protein